MSVTEYHCSNNSSRNFILGILIDNGHNPANDYLVPILKYHQIKPRNLLKSTLNYTTNCFPGKRKVI